MAKTKSGKAKRAKNKNSPRNKTSIKTSVLELGASRIEQADRCFDAKKEKYRHSLPWEAATAPAKRSHRSPEQVC